ncbi:alkaline phosphatase family protein [uncultured Kordia sp.]|uniref:alkaline phosphatase family protein n=1 Tax=uncultured Kordia sp. TaxID=507699 RepID=UPI00263644BB|nr:alkaline phosphatase family protein [uncultured Kordia sp.]
MSKPFDRVITIMFENQYRSYVIQNPFLKKLAAAGADMTNYFGAFHPSQTNYLASFAGEICGITNDTPPAAPLMQETLVDILEAKNVSWKAYMEAYPNESWNPKWANATYPENEQPITQYPPANAKELSRYYRKHNAFASFHNVQKDENRWKKIVSDVEFWQDVASDTLPEYSWFTPDIWNDGHYLYNTHIDTNPRTQLVPQLSAWLEHVFLGNIETSNIQGGAATELDNIGLNLDIDLLLTDPQKAWEQSNVRKGTLLVVTFDEADYDADGYDTNYDGPNQIYTVLLGDMIQPGTVIDTPYNHYNLIRTVQENFQLNSLKKNDYGANWFRFLWNESFAWNLPIDSKISVGNALAVTNGAEGTHMVFSNTDGQLYDSLLTTSDWSQPNKLDIITQGKIVVASIGNKTLLVSTGADGMLMQTMYDSTIKKWSATISLQQKTTGSIALTTYFDMATSENKLMLCWVTKDGFIQSMEGNANGFSGNVVAVNQLTDGDMTLSQLGATLFLVYKERNTRKMRITSYNTGPFNAFEAHDFQGNPAPQNNTTLHKWSVTDFSVGHFSKKMAALADEYQNLGHMALATASGEMHLVHRGGYQDLPNVYTEVFGLTGIYAAESQLSNGYGTLDQAGWTQEQEMTNVAINVKSPIAMSSDEKTLTLVWADANTNTIQYKQGKYS